MTPAQDGARPDLTGSLNCTRNRRISPKTMLSEAHRKIFARDRVLLSLTLNGPRAALVLGAEIKTAATAISGRKSRSFERRRKVVPSVGNRTNDSRRVSSDKSIGGTLLVTTEPAAATEFSPTVTPPMIVAPAAIHTFLSITMGFAIVKARRRDGSTGWPDVTMLTFPVGAAAEGIS
jgi:hypothetical protein